MTFNIFSFDDMFRFLFLMVRISAFVLTLPLLNSRSIPSHLKVVFIIILSFSLYPVVRTQKIFIPQGAVHLALLLLGEIFLGVFLGFMSQALFTGIQLAGTLMDQQMGFSLANILDPQHGMQTTLISNFQYVVALLLFLSMHGHHVLITVMAESLRAIPLLHFAAPRTLIGPLVALIGDVFLMSVRIAAPVMVSLLLINIAMGIVARLVPQMNIFILTFPINAGAGLLILALALPYMLWGWRLWFDDIDQSLFAIIRFMGGT